MKARFSVVPLCGLVVLLVLCIAPVALAQTFEVTERSGDSDLSLDETHLVSYTVQLSGGATLMNVVPTLVPPPCGEVSIGADTVNVFSTSYVGYRSGGSWVTGPISSWASDTTQEVAFYVHLYDEPVGHSLCTDLCTSGVGFGIQFTASAQSSPVAAESSALLDMEPPESGGFELTSLASELYDSIGMIMLTMAFDWLLDTYPLTDDPTDPDVHVFLMFDWNASTQNLPIVFEGMYFPIKDYCGVFVHDAFFHGDISQVQEELYDGTGTLVSGADGLITQAPLGGAGTQNDPIGTGMNFWDLTDLPASCGGSIPLQLGYTPGNSYAANIDVSTVAPPCVMRNAAIYLGRPRVCSAAAEVFGPPTPDFRFQSVEVDAGGNIAATVQVPTMWKSGADLAAGYGIEWFLRNHETFSALSDADSDGVALSLDAVGDFAYPGEYFLEARISHAGAESHYVSVHSSSFDTGGGAGNPPASGAGSPTDSSSDSGCGCRVGRSSSTGSAGLLGWLILLVSLSHRRRRCQV